jgi:agmatine/peptidylarginine deiminase
MQIVRIPMPSHRDGNWRTYTNVIYANGVVLVPQYPDSDPALDKVSLNVFREALPDWTVVGIDCSKLITKRGALHCIARNVPNLGDRR